jgi:F-type H+-transporting ATPase subunit delta
MKKIQAQQYASALFNSLLGKSKQESEDVLRNFIHVLSRNNDFSSSEKIISEFSLLWNRYAGILEAEIISPYPLDSKSENDVKLFLSERTGAKEIVLKTTVFRDILGGLVIKYQDRVLDGSFKAKLSLLKDRMIE